MEEYDRSDARFYDYYSTGVPGDVRFYVEEARRAGSPVLELGCGTGRILIPTAQAGIDIVGLDRSPAMLAIAKEKLSELGPETQQRIELVES
ncbi:MAG TPA: class I SAM-dependent methyltransferase, partial [Anaerolineae bacterium]|nr:class I SAM-dependent methyltransferase [Anaerolineae bacterium]